MKEPRVYKNSPFVFGILFLMLMVISIGAFLSAGTESGNIFAVLPFVLVFALILLVIFFSLSTKVTISEDEISTQNILGSRTLRWTDINRVSGWGSSIKLHNFDGDVTIAPNAQLPGYPEIVEWIGTKRPDLFNPMEYSEMSKSWVSIAILPVFGIAMIGLGVFVTTQIQDTFFPFIILAVFGVVFIGMTFTSVQSISLQGRSMVIGYLFKQKPITADEIASIDLRFTQTRNGKHYFIALSLVNRKTIRLSGLKPNLPVTYLVLKNWHKNNTAIRQTIQ